MVGGEGGAEHEGEQVPQVAWSKCADTLIVVIVIALFKFHFCLCVFIYIK